MNENFGKKSFRRSTDKRILAGVCGGIGEYLGVDPNIVRLAFAVFTLFGGSGILLYIIGWVVIPERDASSSVLEDVVRNVQSKGSGS